MSIFEKIRGWAMERGLYNGEYKAETHVRFAFEEGLESIGYVHAEGFSEWLMYKMPDLYVKYCDYHKVSPDMKETDDYDHLDSSGDTVVFKVNEMYHLGYDPEKCLGEIYKEINSRTGTMVNGKFKKDKSPEAKAKWYKADFSKCKYEEPVKESVTTQHPNGLLENDEAFYHPSWNAKKVLKAYQEIDKESYPVVTDIVKLNIDGVMVWAFPKAF